MRIVEHTSVFFLLATVHLDVHFFKLCNHWFVFNFLKFTCCKWKEIMCFYIIYVKESAYGIRYSVTRLFLTWGMADPIDPTFSDHMG